MAKNNEPSYFARMDKALGINTGGSSSSGSSSSGSSSGGGSSTSSKKKKKEPAYFAEMDKRLGINQPPKTPEKPASVFQDANPYLGNLEQPKSLDLGQPLGSQIASGLGDQKITAPKPVAAPGDLDVTSLLTPQPKTVDPRRSVTPQTVTDTRNKLRSVEQQLSDLDTNVAMTALTGWDTSEAEAQKKQLEAQRDYLSGELKRYQSTLQPEYDKITEQISDLSKRFMESEDQAEKFDLFDQITNLNAQQSQMMEALGIDKKPIVEWDGRQDLIKEYKKLSRADRLNPEQQARLNEVRDKLETGDALAGNGLQSYGFWDRASNVTQGALKNIGSNLVNLGATMFDAYSRGQSQSYSLGNAVTDQLAGIDPMSRIEMQTEDYNSEESQALRQRMYDAADNISEDARESLEKAKGNLGTVGKAGVDIAENILEMGFDAGTAAITGGSALAPMFLRVMGGSMQEARQAGASLDQQLAYGMAKGGIEIGTEMMFDGVAKIYGAGAADEITEELVRKLADTDTGRSFLRLIIGAQGEGVEEVVSDLLSPLADKIYSDESLRDLYSQLDPSDVLYSYIIGSTVGLLGGGMNIVTGGNALSNAELRQRDAAGLNTRTETETQTEAPQTEAPVEAPQAEAQAEANPTDILLDVLNKRNEDTGKVSNSTADAIRSDPALKNAFENAVGEEIKGTSSEQRNFIKDNADKVVSILTGAETTEATETAETAPAETANPVAEALTPATTAEAQTSETASETSAPAEVNTPAAETAVETQNNAVDENAVKPAETEWESKVAQPAEERTYTKTEAKVADMLSFGQEMTNEEVDKILNNKAYRNALKSFGFTFEEGTLSEQRQAVRDFAQRMSEEGIPSVRDVTKLRQDQNIQSPEQALQYEIDKKNEEIEAARKQGDEARKNALERQKAELQRRQDRAKSLKKISKTADNLTQTLLKAKENKYVPKDFVDATTEFIQDLNEARVDRTSDTKKSQRAAAKFDKIAREFGKLREAKSQIDGTEVTGVGYDADVAAMMNNVRDMLAETPLNEMTNDQLQDVENALKAMDNSIRNARNIELGGKKSDLFKTAKEGIRETREEAKGADNAGTKYVSLMERPETFFNKMAGWMKDSVWHDLYDMLNKGQSKTIQMKLEAGKQFSDLIKDKEYKSLRQKVQLKGLTDAQGNPVTISRGMMLSLLFHLNNEQNKNHLSGGGITASGNTADYYRNRHDKGFGRGSKSIFGASPELNRLNYEYKQAKADGDTELMESLQRDMDEAKAKESERLDKLRTEIENQLTPYEQQFVQTAQDFFKWAQKNINETTLDTYGFVKATVDNYFPIDTDADYRGRNLDEKTGDPSLENIKIVQNRTNSNSPIRLLDISDVLDNYINQMARYCGTMPAVRIFNKVYEAQLAGYQGGLKKAVGDTFGKTGQEYIDNLVKDLQGGRKTNGGIVESLLSTTRGNFAASVLTLNPRVAFSQGASWFNAASVVGWDNLAKSMFSKPADVELIAKYSPLLAGRDNRNASFSDNKTSLQDRRNQITRKFGFLLNWINDVDNRTVRSLWNAAESYVQGNYDLAEGTDAYYKQVAEVFDEAVTRTQPGYEVMQRPDILRSPSSLVKTLTMFSTQRLQNFNEVYDRMAQAKKFSEDFKNGKNGVTKADVERANKAATGSVTGVVASSIALTVMKAGVDAILHRTKNYRDDDTGELTPESVLLRIMDYTAESLASNVLGGSQLYQLGKVAINGGKYYGTSVPGVDTISDMTQDIINAFRASEEKRPEAIAKAAGSVATVFGGIPFDNAKDFVDAAINWGDDLKSKDWFESDYEYTTKNNKNIVYDALLNGDDERFNKAMDRMGDKAESNATAVIKEHYDAGELDYEQTKDMLVKAGYDEDDAENKLMDWYADDEYDTNRKEWQKDRGNLALDRSDLGKALHEATVSRDYQDMDEAQQKKVLDTVYGYYKYLSKKEFAEEHGIEYENDTYDKLDGMADPVEYILRSKLWNDAVKNKDYDAIDDMIATTGRLTEENQEYFGEKSYVKSLQEAAGLEEPIHAEDFFNIHDVASEWAKKDSEVKKSGVDDRDYSKMDEILQALIPMFTDDEGNLHEDTLEVFNGTFSHFDELIEAASVGIGTEAWYDIRDEYVRLSDNDELSPTDRHEDINHFIDTYPGLTDEQKATLKEHSTVFAFYAVKDNVYDAMVKGGTDPDIAYGYKQQIDELQPDADHSDVTSTQKAHVILDDKSRPVADRINTLLQTEGAALKPNQGDIAKWLYKNCDSYGEAKAYYKKFAEKYGWSKKSTFEKALKK